MQLQMPLVAITVMFSMATACGQPPSEMDKTNFSVTGVAAEVIPGDQRNELNLRMTFELIIRGAAKVPAAGRLNPVLLVGERDVEITGPDRFLADALAPGDSITATLMATLSEIPPEEPRLLLIIPGAVPAQFAEPVIAGGEEGNRAQPEPERETSLNLNRYFREINPFRIVQCGPEGSLEVIRVSRTLDVPAGWVLAEHLKKRQENTPERMVVIPEEGKTVTATEDFAGWLSGLCRERVANAAEPSVLPMLDQRLRFAALGGIDIPRGSSPFRRPATNRHYATTDDAICAALTPVYRFAAVEQAIADLRSSVPGIRRAALAGAVDRLSEQQASVILENAQSGSVERQLEVAAWLNQVPGNGAIDALRELSLGENEKVAKAALAGLANSLDLRAAEAMTEIWEAGQKRPALRTMAATEMAQSQNDQWVPLLTDYLTEFLNMSTQGQTAGHTPEQVMRVLNYLSERNHPEIVRKLTAGVASVSLTPFQDVLIVHLRRTTEPESIDVIRRVITARLQSGLVTEAIEEAALEIRDPAWTELLLADYQRKLESNAQRPSLRIVLACASPEQLTELSRTFPEHPGADITELLNHMAVTDHPDWRKLAASLLEKPGYSVAGAINLLGADASEESLQILMDRTRRWVDSLEGTRDASLEGQNFLQSLLAHVASFAHPECRRLMNQLSRDPNKWVREMAMELHRNSISRSPAMRSLYEESQARKIGDTKTAFQALDMALKQDPFLPEAWLRRSSERMHVGEFDAALSDLKRADELSPDSTEVTSMMALVMIRQGKVDEGLKVTEQLLSLAPEDDFALYNGACSYARAAERSEVADNDRSRYTERAVELLKKTNETGFTDFEHLSEDVDLLVLHKHPQWNSLIEGARANATKNAEPNEQ
jgi:tetratricopeptide (TPR) repeat protein